MPVNLDKVRPSILEDILDSISDDKAEAETRLKMMSHYEAFDAFLRYNGIIGYTDQILRCQNDLTKAGFGMKVHSTIEG